MSSNPVVLITGAAKRIGATVAKLFHSKGYDVIIHFNRSQQQAMELQENLNRRRRDSTHIIQADLNNEFEVSHLAAQSLACYRRLDVLVNNASRFYPTPLSEVNSAQWHDLIDSNLKAAFFLARELVSELEKQRGAIINIIDIHGEKALKNYPIYSIAKAGLKMMTKSLARELAPAIRVNGVSPGAILWPENPATPQQGASYQDILAQNCIPRSGTPEEVANTVYFLAVEASYITGQTIKVDGGKSLS